MISNNQFKFFRLLFRHKYTTKSITTYFLFQLKNLFEIFFSKSQNNEFCTTRHVDENYLQIKNYFIQLRCNFRI